MRRPGLSGQSSGMAAELFYHEPLADGICIPDRTGIFLPVCLGIVGFSNRPRECLVAGNLGVGAESGQEPALGVAVFLPDFLFGILSLQSDFPP